MFSLKEFIKKGFISAVGHMADYQIILNAVGWFEKGVLTENDLEEIQTAIDGQHLEAGQDTKIPEDMTAEQ